MATDSDKIVMMTDTDNLVPHGYFTEETLLHLIPPCAAKFRWMLRAVEAMLACKLTLVYGRYHMMMDLRSLAIGGHQESYEHAEQMANLLNQLLPFHHTTPSDLLQSQESYADQSIDIYKEYEHYLELFEGECFYPEVAKQLCETVYETDDYYTFKAFSNLNYGVYAETLLLYQIGRIDYSTFVGQFQEISLFNGNRTPLKSRDLKLYLRTMHRVVDLYKSLLTHELNNKHL